MIERMNFDQTAGRAVAIAACLAVPLAGATSQAVAQTAAPTEPAPQQAAELCPALGVGTWIGGDEAASDLSTATAPFDNLQVALPANGNQVSYFRLSAEAEIRAEAAPELGGDTVLELYQADGTFVLSDDDGGGGLASRAETRLAPGSYCMLTRGFGGRETIADIRIARSDFDPLTTGFDDSIGFYGGVETCLPETFASELGTLDASLEGDGISLTNPASVAPYYRFSLTEPQALTIQANNEMADPYIYLYDNAGNLIDENDDFRSLNAQLEFINPLPAGTYCLAMEALSDQNAPITLSMRAYDAERANLEMFAAAEMSPPPGSSYPVTELGLLQSQLVMDQPVRQDAVFYRFTVQEGGLALIEAVEVTDSDPVLRLFDELGREIAYNDDANGTLNSQIVSQIEPGTYTVGVTQFSDSYSGVIRVTLQRYVPAQ